jgi:hypothetical protein
MGCRETRKVRRADVGCQMSEVRGRETKKRFTTENAEDTEKEKKVGR